MRRFYGAIVPGRSGAGLAPERPTPSITQSERTYRTVLSSVRLMYGAWAKTQVRVA